MKKHTYTFYGDWKNGGDIVGLKRLLDHAADSLIEIEGDTSLGILDSESDNRTIPHE